MKPVVAEDYGLGDTSYWAVALAYKTTDITIDTLEGKKSCHTGTCSPYCPYWLWPEPQKVVNIELEFNGNIKLVRLGA